MNNALFHLTGLTLAGSAQPRLNAVTLQIPRGVTAIVGLSGAGKTSLLNVLAGFETGFSGDLKMNVSADATHRLPLFWVPQNGGLWPHLSAEQHLEVSSNTAEFARKISVKLRRCSKKQTNFSSPSISIIAATRYRLSYLRGAFAVRYGVGSGDAGRCLAARRTSQSCGSGSKTDLLEYRARIVAAENLSMIFTSHEPEAVLRHAEHVICLHDGSVVFEGPVRTLYDHPPEACLGVSGPLELVLRGRSVGVAGRTCSRAQMSPCGRSGWRFNTRRLQVLN